MPAHLPTTRANSERPPQALQARNLGQKVTPGERSNFTAPLYIFPLFHTAILFFFSNLDWKNELEEIHVASSL